MVADERIRLLLDMGASAAEAEKVVTALDKLKDSSTKAADATDKAAGRTANLGQSMLQTGRIVQDFAQGGIGGILNNIEGLISALGGGAGLAGALTVAGVAFALARKPLMDLIESMGEGGEKAKGQAEAIRNLADASEKLKVKLAELDALRDASNRKLAEENALLERRIKLEEARREATQRAADEEAKQQQAAARMEGAPGLDAQRRAPSEASRAAELRKIIGGDPEARIIKQRVALAVQNTFGFGHTEAGQETRDAERDRILGAFYAGHADALEYVIGALRSQGGQEGEGPLRSGLEQLTPGAQVGRRMRNVGEVLSGFGGRVLDKAGEEAEKRRVEARKKAAADAARRQRAREAEAEAFRAEVGPEGAGVPGLSGLGMATGLGRRQQEAARRKAAGNLSPEKLMAMDEELRQGVRASQMIRQQTGVSLSPHEALAVMKRSQEEANKARSEGVNAIMSAINGNAQETAMWRAVQRRLMQMQQGPQAGGLQR